MSSPARRLHLDDALVVIALSMFAYRFANRDLLPFINDHGYLLSAAQDEIKDGNWVRASPIMGTQGLRYGPVPSWFYRLVQTVLGPSPVASIFAITAALSLSQLVLAGSLTRALRENRAFFALIAAFMASSPYQFVWARAAWDNTLVEIAVSLVVAILISPTPTRSWRPLAVGLLLGIAIGSHLMVLSFVPVVIGFLVTDSSADKKSRRTAIASIAVAVAMVNVPYALALAGDHAHPSAASSGPVLGRIFAELLQPARVSGLHGIAYFFDDSWADYRAWGGDVAEAFDLFTFPLVIAVLSFAGMILGLKSPARGSRRLAGLALATAVAHAVFLGARGLSLHPHYQYPAWWVVIAGLALFATWLRSSAPRLAPAFVVALWCVTGAQIAFIVFWNSYLRERNGTNGAHYSAPLAEQERVLRAFCKESTGDASIENDTKTVFSSTLSYILRTDLACASKPIAICDAPCATTATAQRQFVLRFAEPAGGSLLLTPKGP